MNKCFYLDRVLPQSSKATLRHSSKTKMWRLCQCRIVRNIIKSQGSLHNATLLLMGGYRMKDILIY